MSKVFLIQFPILVLLSTINIFVFLFTYDEFEDIDGIITIINLLPVPIYLIEVVLNASRIDEMWRSVEQIHVKLGKLSQFKIAKVSNQIIMKVLILITIFILQDLMINCDLFLDGKTTIRM